MKIEFHLLLNEKEKNLYLHNPWLKNGEYFNYTAIPESFKNQRRTDKGRTTSIGSRKR